jgi:hypothetical protein
VANAAIVPAGTNESISVFVSNPTDVILDINGYFGPPGARARCRSTGDAVPGGGHAECQWPVRRPGDGGGGDALVCDSGQRLLTCLRRRRRIR